MFGEDIKSIESEKEYKESIAEKVKTRRQNKETDRDTQRTFAPQDSSINLDNFKGRGLKILSKQQMLSRFPILLAQIQAGNYSNKLKNELRQFIYSLYRLKKITKTVYNNLIKVM